MPYLNTSRSPEALAHAVKQFHQRFRCLVAVTAPDIAQGGETAYFLYGDHDSCANALEEAANDRPGAVMHGEYEYLPPAFLTSLRDQVAQDPVSQALHSMGRVKPGE